MKAYRCINCKHTCTSFRPFVPSCGWCGSGPAWQQEIFSDENDPLKPQPKDGRTEAAGRERDD